MPDKRRGFKHFFCQHPIVGVNWRTTWLVEEPADSTVCSVCGMIPRKTVYCWNEANGCNFIGTPGQSLLHFENECGFHARVCPLCQKEVLHKDLVAHRRDECSSNASPSCTRRSDSHSNDVPSEGFDLTQKGADMVAGDTSEDTALPMPATSATGDTDANESSEKAVDGYSSNDIALPARLTLTSKGLNVTEENENNFTLNTFRDSALPTDQIEMNEQRTHLSSEEATLDNVTPGVRSSEQTLREEITEIIREAISSCLPQQLSSRELVGQHATPPPPSTLSPEETLILRKLEHFANTTLSTLEDLRQIMAEQCRSPHFYPEGGITLTDVVPRRRLKPREVQNMEAATESQTLSASSMASSVGRVPGAT
ncbi:hypothetical protein HPB50_009636 [Hyalomma asiaticum]|uniref:Uncharacterized protein n=1 Tax=Hyalomma asiaticum TaxID=266040 RepID=A0ACB7T8W2_HYAAI|nr:hypothetical protein HPB50_009636 [Hyalomma asiaticum]